MAGDKAVRALVVDDDPCLIREYRQVLNAGTEGLLESDGLFSTPDSDLFGAAIGHKEFPAVELAAFRMGQEAVEAVRDSQESGSPFSIAFIGMQMNAGLGGIETAERIRALDAQIQIVVMTGRGMLHPVDLVTRIPPADRMSFIRKPFHPFEIQHLLLGCLHRRRVEAREPAQGPGGNGDSNRSILRAILDRLPAGVLVFDRRDQLVVANAEIGRLFPDSATLFAPGARYDEICREFNTESTANWGMLGDRKIWQLQGPRWVMVMEEIAPTGETYCLFSDVTDLKNRDGAYWRAQHSAHLAKVFSTLCDTVERQLVTTGGADMVLSRLRAVAQQRHLTPRVVGLSQFLARAMRRVRRSLPAGISLEAVLDAELWSVEIDSDGLARALAELTANACEAMSKGGRIIVEAANVRMTTESRVVRLGLKAGDYVRLSVQDTGQGMPQDWADRSFLPIQAEANGEHVGLGLTIVRAFAIESKGWLDTDSGTGGGATIHLYLPKMVSVDASENLARLAGNGSGESTAKPTLSAIHGTLSRRTRRSPPVVVDWS